MVYVPTTYQISPLSCHYYASSLYLCRLQFSVLSKKATMPIIDYRNVDIQIDSHIILEDVTFSLNAGDYRTAIFPDAVRHLP